MIRLTWGFASIMIPQGIFRFPPIYSPKFLIHTIFTCGPHVNRVATIFYRFIESFFFLGLKCADDLNYKLNFSSPTSSNLLGLLFQYFSNKEFWNTIEAPPTGIQRKQPNHWKHSYAIFKVHTLNLRDLVCTYSQICISFYWWIKRK